MRAKILLGYVVVVMGLIVSVAIVINQLAALQKEIHFLSEHDLEVHNLTNQIEKNLLDMETGQRGFLITGDANYLVPYNNGYSEWQESYNKLTELLSDNPSQQSKLADIRTNIQHWIRLAAEPTIQMKKENKTEAILNFFVTDVGKRDMDQIRKQFEAFRVTEKQLTQQRTLRLDEQNELMKNVLYALMAFVILLSLTTNIIISGAILKTIRQVIGAVGEIASRGGDLSRRIEVRTADEISDLASATNQMLDRVEEQDWRKTQVADIIGSIQGMKDLQALSETLIRKIALLLGASYGIIYLREVEDGRQLMVRSASFAASGLDEGEDRFYMGEGLVGQAALDSRQFHLRDIPANRMRITSGLLDSEPVSLLITPITYEDRVKAVIELASLNGFEDVHLQLLSEINTVLGTTLMTVRSRMEVDRLLAESQTMTEELRVQSEELQMQQEELQITNEQLEEQNRNAEEKSKELEQIRIELEAYASQLEQSSRYKSEFLANMSHELRTPLNSMLILSQMMAEDRKGDLSPEYIEYARVIHSAGSDLLLLINDILDLSKVEAGKLEISVETMNLTELPTVMQYLFAQTAEQKGLSYSFTMDPELPDTIYTDSLRLQQILKNLLSNAFKFTERGSVSGRIRKADRSLLQQHAPELLDAEAIEIAITDTGIGIPRDKQELIFEAFRQADGKTNRKYGGTGLGLSISRELARLLGGKIVLESEEGRGSTFTLILPCLKDHELLRQAAEENEARAARSEAAVALQSGDALQPLIPVSPEEKKFSGKRVLIVDDDIRNVFALTNALEKVGIEVLIATDGQECLDMLEREEAVDLVLMDIMLPVIDGYDAMKQIRSEARFATLPIIALTAKAMKQDREKCLEAGASDYISKPIQIPQLFSLMSVWLAK